MHITPGIITAPFPLSLLLWYDSFWSIKGMLSLPMPTLSSTIAFINGFLTLTNISLSTPIKLGTTAPPPPPPPPPPTSIPPSPPSSLPLPPPTHLHTHTHIKKLLDFNQLKNMKKAKHPSTCSTPCMKTWYTGPSWHHRPISMSAKLK